MANQRLDATITIGSVLERSVGKNLNIIRRGLDGVGDEIKKVTDRQRELSKQRKVLERQGQSVEALDREYEQLGRTLDDLRRKQERFERAQGAANRVGRQFQSTIGTIGRQARTVGIAMGAIGTAAVGVTETTANAAREVRLFSQLAGAGETEFQRFAAGAKSVGIENDKLSDILKDTNDRIGDFVQTGGGPMADFFEKIGPLVGVTVDDFKELSGPQALQLYVSSLEKANLSQADMTFYMEAMASDSTALIPLLQDNGKAMREIGDEAERTGQIMSKEALDAAEKYRREMGRAGGALTGVRNIIGEQLMPVIGELAGRFADFVRDNRPQIEEFGKSLAEAIKGIDFGQLFSDIDGLFTKVGNVTNKLEEMGIGWSDIGIALGVLMTSPSIVAVGGFVVTVGKLAIALKALASASLLPAITAKVTALGTAIAATPIGFLIAGAASVAAGAYLIYKNWDGVKEWFAGLWGNVTDIFKGFGQFVGGIFTGDLTGAVDGIKLAWQGWHDTTYAILNGIGNTFAAVWTDLIKPVTDKLGMTDGIVSAWTSLQDGIGSVLNWMGEKFDWILGKLQPLLDKLQWVQEKGVGVISSVTDFFGFGGDEDPTKRAIGGAFGASRPLLVGERGPELIYPNQGGFVAHHRAVERLAKLSAQARTGIGAANENTAPNIGRLASEIGSIGRAVAAAAGAMVATSADMQPSPIAAVTSAPAQMIQQQGARSASVVQNITINAPQNMDVQQLVAELERLKSLAQNDALFDGANDWGQYA